MTTKKKEPDKSAAPDGATLGSWRGLTTYCCTKCGYDTVERAKFEDHYAVAHPALQDHFEEAPAPITDPTGLEG